MAKGDSGMVPQYGGQGQPNPAGAGGASKSMNDILALLQHLGIGAQGAMQGIQGTMGGNNPQFGSNMMAGMRKVQGGQDYGNMAQQRGWGIGVGNPHSGMSNPAIGMDRNNPVHQPMINPQGMTRAPQPSMGNPIATFPEQGRDIHHGGNIGAPSIGMPSLLPSGGAPWMGGGSGPLPSAGGGGQLPGMDWQGIPGVTRSGSNLMRGGQQWGHVGNNNQAVWNNGFGPFDIETFAGGGSNNPIHAMGSGNQTTRQGMPFNPKFPGITG